ncbi:hypothetical protein CAPTEDRAFT_223029 [Capitella teleta]|uniref:CRAL-TRIO domain-containing protein n=1 Tax=Capitella teleta TaxID=283909 RepID=R7TFX8_CAPTE|nr:hypothetical protein CAPTEDRAFT_223029 [Capitella teleta]|eukprot:ELT89951.1 hypothetical protein CAPTEDRAFT_223029 [Capitella teleta]
MADKIKELRACFLEKYSGSIIDDTYDDRDVKWVKKSDALLQNVLDAHKCKGDVKKGADMLNEILMFRIKYNLNDLKEEELHPELIQKKPMTWMGVDKEGRKIMHIRVSSSKKGHLIEESKKGFAFHMNEVYFEHPEQKIVLLFDFTDAGVSNMDLDLSKHIVACGNTYFPGVAGLSLNFKMSLPLEAVYKVIASWFDPNQAKITRMVTKSNIQEYINKDQLLPHMIKEAK